jgi:4-oxalocrotonate tautomerase
MPFINVKLAGTPPTQEQKETLIREFTRVLAETLGKNPATTVVIIEEVPTDNWGIGGESVTTRNKRK